MKKKEIRRNVWKAKEILVTYMFGEISILFWPQALDWSAEGRFHI